MSSHHPARDHQLRTRGMISNNVSSLVNFSLDLSIGTSCEIVNEREEGRRPRQKRTVSFTL